MPVAISVSNTANSAAQFIDGAVNGDVVSSASTSSANVNRSAASSLSKDRESSDDDFNAVLAMLLNGGVPHSLTNDRQVSTATTQPERGGTSLQISNDATNLPTQELPISGTATEADGATTAINVTVEARPSEFVIVKPMSNELIRALGQIGRSPASEIDTEYPQQQTTPEAKSLVSAVSGTGVSDVAPQLTVDLVAGLNSTAVAEPATVLQVPSVESDAAAGEPLPLTSDLKTRIDSLSNGTTATMQSGLIPLASLNGVPDLAASISAEIRQPLTSQVSQAIMDHVERNGVRQNDSLSVRLDPPELGEMTIQLSKTHEGLAVRVTAREAVTMDMLFARGQEIESQLRGQNMNLKSLEFQRTDMSSSGFSQGQGQSQQKNSSSRRSENLSNQIRSGTRGLSLSNPGIRSATPDSSYGLSFRA